MPGPLRLLRPRLTFALVVLVVSACAGDETVEPPTDPAAAADTALSAAAARPTTTTSPPPVPVESIPVDLPPIDADTPSLDEPYVPPGPGDVIIHYNLRTDDCFDRIEELVSGRTRVTTTRLPCDEPHRFQVFGRLDYPAEHPSIYPGDDVMEDFALQSCYRFFEPWVDAVYETSSLEISILTPNQEDFEDDANRYRGIHCVVRRLDGEPLVGTARRSGL